MIFPESQLAHKYCKGKGLEIGAGAHNPFGLNTLNVSLAMPVDQEQELKMCGKNAPADIHASGDNIPVPDASQDFVVSLHLLEHFPDVIKTLLEWYRVLKPGGIIFMIVPHMERTFDKDNPRTTLNHIIEDYKKGATIETHEVLPGGHYHAWITEDVVEIVDWLKKEKKLPIKILEVQDVDDKVGNGFSVVVKKLR